MQGDKKKVLLLFDFACHPCTGTMLIFSVYLSVCLMSQPEGWTLITAKNKYINCHTFLGQLYCGTSIIQEKEGNLGLGQNPGHAHFFFYKHEVFR